MAVVFISCFFASDAVFAVLDILLAIVGIINVFVIFKLSKRAVEAYRDYRRQKEEGIKEPEFHKSALSDDTGVTEWD
jgi:Na+/alanine symporter